MKDRWADLAGRPLRPGGAALTELLIAKLPAPPVAVLDVGCATGASVDLLRRHGYEAWGLDASEKLIARGHSEHPQAALVAGDAAAMPFSDQKFAAILCECTLSLLPPPAWRECARVLQGGGLLVFSDLYARQEQAASALSAGSSPGSITPPSCWWWPAS